MCNMNSLQIYLPCNFSPKKQLAWDIQVSLGVTIHSMYSIVPNQHQTLVIAVVARAAVTSFAVYGSLSTSDLTTGICTKDQQWKAVI